MRATIALVRDIAREMKRPVAILGDLQGPRIRIGDLAGVARAGRRRRSRVRARGGQRRGDEVPVTYADLARRRARRRPHPRERRPARARGARRRRSRACAARVLHGGATQSHKGMNLPGVEGVGAVAHRQGPRGRRVRHRAGARLPRAELRPPRRRTSPRSGRCSPRGCSSSPRSRRTARSENIEDDRPGVRRA